MLEVSSCSSYLSSFSCKRQRVSLDGKVSTSVDVVSGEPQGSVLGPLLFILYTFDLFHVVGSHIVGYASDTMIYAIIPRPLSRPQMIESLNQDLATKNSWCLK